MESHEILRPTHAPLFFLWLLPNGGTLGWLVKEDGRRNQRNTCKMHFNRNLVNWDLGEIPHPIVEMYHNWIWMLTSHKGKKIGKLVSSICCSTISASCVASIFEGIWTFALLFLFLGSWFFLPSTNFNLFKFSKKPWSYFFLILAFNVGLLSLGKSKYHPHSLRWEGL